MPGFVQCTLIEQEGYTQPDGGSIGDFQVLSLFTNKGQFWGDAEWGSELESIFQDGVTPTALRKVELFAKESQQWLIDDGIAEQIICVATLGGPSGNIPFLEVVTTRPGNLNEPLRQVWQLTIGG